MIRIQYSLHPITGDIKADLVPEDQQIPSIRPEDYTFAGATVLNAYLMESYYSKWRDLTETQLHKLSLYQCSDQDAPQMILNRAELTLPRNLSLKLSRNSKESMKEGVLGVWSNILIPRGSRFGPFVGDIISNESSCHPGVDKKHFWRVFNKISNKEAFIIDGKDTNISNWMRHVQPSYDRNTQNIVAYQEGNEIYFLTIQDIPANIELTVYYAADFARRINAPLFLDELQVYRGPPHHQGPDEAGDHQDGTEDTDTVIRQLQGVLASQRRIGHGSPASDSSGYMSTLSPQNMLHHRLGSTSPNASSGSTANINNEEQVLDLSNNRRPSTTSEGSSRSSPNIYSTASQRTTPSPIKEEDQPVALLSRGPLVFGFHNSLPSSIPSTSSAAAGITGGQFVRFNPACIQTRRDAIDYESVNQRNLLIQPVDAPQPQVYEQPPQVQQPPRLNLPLVPPPGVMALAHRQPLPLVNLQQQVPEQNPPAAPPRFWYPEHGHIQTPPPIIEQEKLLQERQRQEEEEEPMPLHPVPSTSKGVTKGGKKGGGGAPRGSRGLPFELKKVNGKYEYRCDICAKVFGQLSNLKVHHRTHTGERPYICEQCPKSFTQLAHKEKHSLVHTGEKPHQCKECGKRFSSTSNLKTHYRLHTGEKPYSCPTCCRDYTQRVHMKLHTHVHHGKKPYVCDSCGKSYTSVSGLKTHWKAHIPCSSPNEEEQEERVKRIKAKNASMLCAHGHPHPRVDSPLLSTDGSPGPGPSSPHVSQDQHVSQEQHVPHERHVPVPQDPEPHVSAVVIKTETVVSTQNGVTISQIGGPQQQQQPMEVEQQQQQQQQHQHQHQPRYQYMSPLRHEFHDSHEVAEQVEPEVPAHRMMTVTRVTDHVEFADSVLSHQSVPTMVIRSDSPDDISRMRSSEQDTDQAINFKMEAR